MSRRVRRSTATAADLKAPPAPVRCCCCWATEGGKGKPPASCGRQELGATVADQAQRGRGGGCGAARRRAAHPGCVWYDRARARSSDARTSMLCQLGRAPIQLLPEQPHLLAQLCSPWTGPARGPGAQGSSWAGQGGPRHGGGRAGTLTTLDTETPAPQRASCLSAGLIGPRTGSVPLWGWREGRRAAGAEGGKGAGGAAPGRPVSASNVPWGSQLRVAKCLQADPLPLFVPKPIHARDVLRVLCTPEALPPLPACPGPFPAR